MSMTTLPEEAVKAADIIQVITDLRLAILQDDDEGLAEHADPMIKAKELIVKLSASPFLSVQGKGEREAVLNYKAKLRVAFRKALSDLPEIAPAEVASILSSVHMQDEFWREGKRLQLEHGLDAVAPRVEQECGAGAWSFIRQGILSALEPSAARELALVDALEVAKNELQAWIKCADENGLCVTSTPHVIDHIDIALASLSSPGHADAGKVEGDGLQSSAISNLIEAAKEEAAKAMRKFPQPNYVISKIAEEAGEVVKAAIHCAEGRENPEAVIAEIKQTFAMLFRLLLEGDEVHGLPPLLPSAPASEGEE